MTSQEEALKKIIDLQAKPEGRYQARELCFSHLSDNPSAHRVRLALSRLYYLDGYYDFARRELVFLRGKIKNPILDKLLEALGEGRETVEGGEVTLAEITLTGSQDR
ncbi:MAG TPA: hypothetical protein PKA63_11795 [Oligoflexia bacterium]|nr:hypothetical protein [Oligoflexia bacterium]HMP49336.1 hypothetical protein [Oligoflexia bacterium]